MSGSGIRPVYILDTIGRLNDFYSIASIVFIGGSLVNHGGQNPIEPAIYAKPIVFGQYMFNFKNITEAFLAKGAAVRLDSAGELIPVLYNLLADEKQRLEVGRKAKQTVTDNRGATEQVLNEMGRFLNA